VRSIFPGSLLCALICLPATGSAQNTPASTQPAATFRTSTDLVVVDVVARDAQHHSIRGLTPADFVLLENGKPQTVKVFEEHSAPAASNRPPLPKLAPGVFTNYTPAPAAGALNILLFDRLNTPADAQTVLTDQVLKYLKDTPPRAPMAIFGLTTRLLLLQSFTSDPELLHAVVSGKQNLASGSALMNEPLTGDEAGADDPVQQLADTYLVSNSDIQALLDNMQQLQAQMMSYQLQLRAQTTLDALNVLARYLSALPGRKNLIWFSGSFPVNILPDKDILRPFAVVASAQAEYRETIELLSRAQVAVYPIDVRGLMTIPDLDVARARPDFAVRANGSFGADLDKFNQQTNDEQSTMRQMADDTGGKAFVDDNGLKAAVQEAVDEGSDYYTLAYTPADRNWNGDYRRIQVKLSRGGVTLAYRHGYYADSPTTAPHRGSEVQEQEREALPSYDPLRAAMLYGAPQPTQIVFAASVRPAAVGAERAAAQGNRPAANVACPFRRYTVDFFFNPASLDCPAAPDGNRHCVVEFTAFVYNRDGVLVNFESEPVRISLDAAGYAAALKDHLHHRQQISVPVKGDFDLRLGIRDAGTNHLGAVELPLAAVATLPPLPAQQSAATPPAPSQK
jgi:VWFA-related protein